MAKNRVFTNGWQLSVPCTDPTVPVSGSPVRFGVRTGVAMTNEGAGGNTAANTTVDFGPTVWSLSVAAVNAAINVGDALWYHDGGGSPPTINNVVTGGYFFGVANGALNSGVTGTIDVAHIDAARPVGT